MNRAIQFVVECVAGIAVAGVLLAVALPLLRRNELTPDQPWLGVLVWGTVAVLVALAVLRPKGSLRR